MLHVIPARIIVPKSCKKSKPGNAFNCLLHENKTVSMTNFEDKTSSVIKMSKSDLINSALEGENDGIEESENSDDEYLPDLTKLQSCIKERCVWKESMKENCPGKESTVSEEDTSRTGNTVWCSCGKYKPMATHTESICFFDKYEICESNFKGILSFAFEIF